ncbi:MAG: proton-conducting transporter membrane subunit [Candidatus Zixiibacteriota bacterium]
MSIKLILVAVGLILLSGGISLIARRNARVATAVGMSGIILASLVGLTAVAGIFPGGSSELLRWAWSIPGGSFAVGVDPLSAVFLFILFFVSIPVCLFGASYLRSYGSEQNPGTTWFFTGLLIASMAMTVIARNVVLFMVSWELMSVSSFFLVTFEKGNPTTKSVGLIYLVAAHIGAAFLLILFILLGRNGSLDFDQFSVAGNAGLLFILCLVGFGTKAGFVPLHVWLPEAHPAAPSHISALMSGVMIKMGIYGILRTLTFLGHPQPWWGWLLLGVGVTSGILGVLFALAQHDVKRLLAYHSVENIGIIGIGLGIGLLGMSYNAPMIVVLGFGGGIFHVVNHSLFKGLLFLGAGSVAHAAGTREIDRLGGLLKLMPWTAAMFLAGSVAICGLPPLNGFASEFLIYLAAFYGGTGTIAATAVAGLVGILGLAIIGGLAIACFTKVFSIMFLGELRSELDREIHEASTAMIMSMVILAGACFGIGFLAPFVVDALAPSIAVVAQMPPAVADELLSQATAPLRSVTMVAIVLAGVVLMFVLVRLMLLRKKPVQSAVTWDCGYAAPTARMQYTAASFVQPITTLFYRVLRTRRHLKTPEGPFPTTAAVETHTPDTFQEWLFRPILTGTERVLSVFRWLQHGNVHIYVMYILVILVALMFWKMR